MARWDDPLREELHNRPECMPPCWIPVERATLLGNNGVGCWRYPETLAHQKGGKDGTDKDTVQLHVQRDGKTARLARAFVSYIRMWMAKGAWGIRKQQTAMIVRASRLVSSNHGRRFCSGEKNKQQAAEIRTRNSKPKT